jgi:uncharacterized protein involved in exopolysaccharide biosynthesis
MDQSSFDLFELLKIVLANRKLIALIVILAALAAVLYSLLAPQIWASRASFFAVGEAITDLPFNIPGISSISASLLGTDSSDKAENFITVMQSRTFSEEVIRKFNLIPYFKLHNPDSLRNMDDALKKLSSKVISMDIDTNSGLISIAAKTKNKQLSLDIVNHYLKRLDEYNRKQKVTQSKLNREFLEERVNETRAILDSLIAVNRSFQEKNKAIDLETQAKAMVDSYGALIAEKMKLDIELELAKASYGNSSPLLKELILKKDVLENQIRSLENSGKTPKPEYLLDIDKIPLISSQYAQIKMNLEIYKAVYEFLYPQYEAARLSELKDMPTLEILDQPRLAGRRDSPRRAIICIIATLVAFLMAIMIALIKEMVAKNLYRLRSTPK